MDYSSSRLLFFYKKAGYYRDISMICPFGRILVLSPRPVETLDRTVYCRIILNLSLADADHFSKTPILSTERDESKQAT